MDFIQTLTSPNFTALANIIGIIGAFSAIATWLYLQIEQWRKRHPIIVRLRAGRRSIDLPAPIQRGEFSRAEIQGRLGTLPKHQPGRYQIAYTNTKEYIDNIYRVANGWQIRLLEINCSNEELDQFDVVIQDM